MASLSRFRLQGLGSGPDHKSYNLKGFWCQVKTLNPISWELLTLRVLVGLGFKV